MSNAGDAFDQAFRLVQSYKDSSMRAESLDIRPTVDPTVLYPLVLAHEISTKVTAQLNSTRNPALLNRQYHIEGIKEEWDAEFPDDLKISFQLWDVEKGWWIFPTRYYDGEVSNSGIYTPTHDDTTGDYVSVDGNRIRVGQWYDAALATHAICRGYINFLTSSIGSKTIESAKIICQVDGLYTIDNSFDLTIVPATGVGYILTAADYGDMLDDVTDYGHATISSPAIGPQIIIIELNNDGIAAINKSGVTHFGIRSSRDISSTAPGTSPAQTEFIGIKSSEGGFAPRLVVKLT